MNRPWITPDDVKNYTDHYAVASRNDAKLAVDISRAEKYIISYTNNDFADDEQLPSDVSMATMLLAEAYAYNAIKATKEVKSETFDDYSYTATDKGIDIDEIGLDVLLDGYVITQSGNSVTMTMRSL